MTRCRPPARHAAAPSRSRPHILLLAAALATAGCAQPRLAGRTCPLRILPVEVGSVPQPGVAEADRSETFRQALERSLAPPIGPQSMAADVPDYLVLSGGGKWGAYGAGFLEALPNRPEYRVVTGVSTGALQASFALLADQPVPASRAAIYTEANDLALGPGEPRPGAGRLFIHDLARAYRVSRSETIVDVRGDELTALRRGAAADFEPLRRRLNLLIDRDMMERIALATKRDGRGLYVGVADMDDGRAYAIDLGDLADRAVKAGSGFDALRDCYVDALIASSSEPLQAPPVFMNTERFGSRMYLDGGLRNGVFLQEVLDAGDDPKLAGARPRFDTTVIVNGELAVRDNAADPPGNWAGKWSLLTLLARTKDLLVNQIYEFSVDRVRQHGSGRGAVSLTTARGYEAHALDGRTCAEWRREESDLAFPPRFMACLIDWGRRRGAGADGRWDVETPAPVASR